MRKNCLPVYDDKKCALFALGRNAMYAGCQTLGLKPGDEVLTPAFDCDAALQPFRVMGLKLSFFRSDPYTFSADVSDIEERITGKTKLIHIVNHFGMPQPWEKLLSLEKEKEIPILEDNAYSLFSKYQNRQFGTFGDISVFSLRKNLPLIDGGMLRINNPAYSFKSGGDDAPLFYHTELGNVLNILKTKLGFYKIPRNIRKIVKKISPSAEPPPSLYSETEKGYPELPSRDEIGKEFSCDYLRPMSRLARFQLNGFSEADYDEIIEKKRECYLFLSKMTKDIGGIKILWPELPEGAAPFCFSFLIEKKRDLFYDLLIKKYDVTVWPTLPGEVLENLSDYPDVELLGRRLLQINLSADKVRRSDFTDLLGNLVKDITKIRQ